MPQRPTRFRQQQSPRELILSWRIVRPWRHDANRARVGDLLTQVLRDVLHDEEQDTAFHRRVREAYRQLASDEPRRVRLIDGSQPRESVAQQVWEAVQKL